MLDRLITVFRAKVGHLVHELAKFGVVGAVGMVVDLGVFNILRYDFGGTGVLSDKPLTARAISITLATIVTYAGNRFWTWKHRERRAMRREYALFFLLNVVGFAINLAVLGIAIYVLELHGQVWDNLASLTGIAIGTLFRFWSYRRWVFRARREPTGDPETVAVGGR